MLGGNVIETPRPRPPAKARRTSLKAAAADSSPPPSYASSAFSYTRTRDTRLDEYLGSTFMKPQLSPAAEEGEALDGLQGMSDKSREELEELLVKADGLIKERENELGLASAVCKNLYENNVALKSKHQALLARLPSSPSLSPSPEPLSRTSSRYSITLNRPVSETSPGMPVNARKISMSNAEIAMLADQNAELLDKLEKLETESYQADQAGRRVLKRLEKEITQLREELEKTQAKSEELEEKTKAGFGWDSHKVVEEVLRKKMEREEKLKAMRGLGHGRADDQDSGTIRDFAPSSSLLPKQSSKPASSRVQKTASHFDEERDQPQLQSPPEASLISQLMAKMRELEETNVRIMEQQQQTTEQLNAMQKETEQISRVYECLDDGNIIELASEFAPEDDPAKSRDNTIRFRSLQRQLSEPPEDVIMLRTASTSSSVLASSNKIRKSVMGLFDESRCRGSPVRQSSLPVPFTMTGTGKHHSSQSSSSIGLVSPALSPLSMSPQSQSASLSDGSHRTLETELANEMQGGWGLEGGDMHHRSNSLYEFSRMSLSRSPSPFPSPSPMSHLESHSSGHEEESSLPTPMSIADSSLQLLVEAPTPEKPVNAGHARHDSMSKATARYQRMTETVRSRTGRWADGRFRGSFSRGPGPNFDVQSDDRQTDFLPPATPVALRLMNAFDATVDNVSGGELGVRDSSVDNKEESGSTALEKRDERKARGFGAFVLELWLWLQFAVIILVFLWAMAKRGPKSVLGEARHRRISSTRRP